MASGIGGANRPGENNSRFLPVFNIGFGTAGMGLGILDWVRFSQRREESIIRRFEQGQSLPRYVQRQFVFALARERTRQNRFSN